MATLTIDNEAKGDQGAVVVGVLSKTIERLVDCAFARRGEVSQYVAGLLVQFESVVARCYGSSPMIAAISASLRPSSSRRTSSQAVLPPSTLLSAD